MARNFVQTGRAITLIAPYDVSSGDGLLVGAIFGVASGDAAIGAEVEADLVGVFDLKKAASQAWTIGDKIYWDNTNKETTKTATGNTLIGAAVAAVGNGAAETIGRVRLNGTVS
jgi:predicted RecA/RadA family phage recombinase